MGHITHGLGFMAFDTADLDGSLREAVEVMGLRIVHQDARMAILTSNAKRAELVLHAAEPGERSGGMRAIGLQAHDAEAVTAAAARAQAAGLSIVSTTPSLPFLERSVTFLTPEGHAFEVHTPIPEDQPLRYVAPGVHPRKLDHVGPKTRDTVELARVLNQVLGLQISDRSSGNELCFMRSGNGQHHTCSLIKDDEPGLHHYAWEFWDVTDFVKLGDGLALADRRLTFGPGRHGAGDNIYTYHLDRTGVMVECCTGMEIVNDDAHREIKVWESADPNLINLWGVMPPEAWLSHRSPLSSRG